MALTGEELGAVEAEGFDADEDLAGFGGGDGAVLELEDFWAAGLVDYCGAYGCHFDYVGWWL
jgi:hypothetical protein